MHTPAFSGPSPFSPYGGRTHRSAVIRFVFLSFLLPALAMHPRTCVAAGFDAAGAARAQTPAPFLTSVRESDGEDRDKRLHLPARTTIDTPYQDTPFIVQVPFEVRHEGGVVRVHTNTTFKFDNAAHATVWDERFIVAWSHGIYRLDGKKLPENSVLYDWRGGSERTDWKPLRFHAEAPTPTWSARSQGSIRISRVRDRHAPFAELNGEGTPGVLNAGPSYVLSPAEPGWYVFWFSVEAKDWPRDPNVDVIQPRFFVDVLVARGERKASREELAYIFDKDKPRPQEMREDKFFLPLSFEVPVKVIRDGWVFDHAVVRLDDKRIEAKPTTLGSYPAVFDVSATPGINTELRVTSTVSSEESRGTGGQINRAEVIVKDEYGWSVKFPQIIPDHSFATLEIGGQHERYVNSAHVLFKNAKKAEEDFSTLAPWSWTPSFVKRGEAGWYLGDEEKKSLKSAESPGLYIDYTAHTETGSTSPDDEKRAREYFLKEYGEQAAQSFFFDHRGQDVQKKGAKPHRFLLRGYPPSARHRITENGGAYPLLAYSVGPWKVLAFYQRLKDGREGTGGPPAGGEVKVVPDKDPFFTWLREYSDLLNEKQKVVDDAMKTARAIQVPLRLAIESNKRLLSMARAGENRGAADRALDAVFGGETPIDAATRAKIMVHARAQGARIRAYHDELAARTTAGTKALEDVLARIAKPLKTGGRDGKLSAEDQYRDRHPQILNYKRAIRKQYEQFPLKLAAESGDSAALHKAVEWVDPLAASAETRLLQADLQLKENDMIGALYAFRSAVAVEPENPDARKGLREVECAFIKSALTKTQGEVAAAREAFFKYLKERGFSAEDKGHTPVGDVADLPWYKQLYVSMTTLDTESAWAIFSTGAIGSLMAINGKVAGKATTLDTTERQMATAFLGLNAILRLRLRDHTLEQIAAMDVETMRIALRPKHVSGRAYSADEAAQLREAMVQAMRLLPDMKALFENDRMALERAVQKSYNLADVEETWIEWFGDLTSVKNLAPMLMPFAVARVGGRLMGVGYWGAREIAIVERAAAGGKVVTGTEAVLQLVGMGRALTALGSSPLGRFLAEDLAKFQQYQESLGLLDKGIWGTGKIMGVMIFQVTSLHLAEKYGGPKAALVAEAVLIFGGDFDVLIKFLNKAGLPPQQVARVLGKHVVPMLEANIKSMTAVQLGVDELEALLARARSGKPVKPQELAALELSFGDNWMRAIPTGDAAHDASMLLTAGKVGLREGVDNGAVAEAKKLAERAAREQREIQEILQAIEQRKQQLAAAEQVPAAAVVGDAPSVKPGLTPRVDASPAPKGYPVGPRPRRTSLTARANAAMQAGDFTTAKDLYEQAIELIQTGFKTEADELPLDRLALKVKEAIAARASIKRTPKAESLRLLTPVSEADAAFAMTNKGPDFGRKGAFGDLYEVNGRPDLLIKEILPSKGNPIREAEAEAVHQALARAIGLEVPGTRVTLVRNARGEVEKAVMVMRKIDGDEMQRMDVGEIFLYREQLSRHRPLALLHGDRDRHLGNYIVTKDGRFLPLDAGLGDPTGSKARRAGKALDDPHLISGRDGRDHFIARIAEGENGGPVANFHIHRLLVAEEAITYQAAKPTVDALTDLIVNKPRELRTRLKEAFGPLYGHDEALLLQKVDETIENLRARIDDLDEVMRGFNDRNGVPLDAPVLQVWLWQLRNDVVRFLAESAPRSTRESRFDGRAGPRVHARFREPSGVDHRPSRTTPMQCFEPQRAA